MKAAVIGKPTNNYKLKFWYDFLQISAGFSALLAITAVVIGCLSLAFNSQEKYAVPLLFTIAAAFALLFGIIRQRLKTYNFAILLVSLAALGAGLILYLLPAYMHGLSINGLIHRSVISGLFLVAIGLPSCCYSILYLLKATPRGFDVSRYPLIIFLVGVALLAYGLIIFYIIQKGALQLDWSLFTNSFQSQSKIIQEWQDGWPVFTTVTVKQVGILNHILGTLMLMGLTSLISLPIGIGVGVFVHEYAHSKLAGIINFSATALRSISGIILAVSAVSLLNSVQPGSFWYDLFHGYGIDVNNFSQLGRSSFLFASTFISLLVIPIIAKATQEGLSSLPKDIQEGSLAIGASREHTLLHIQLPWSLPNIVTGLVLGCAEAAGALTIIFLFSGVGQYGVSPLHETTSLAYLIFDIRFGPEMGDPVGNMKAYQFTTALVLLVITMGLTAAALIMKKSLAKRYKGA